MSRSYYLELLLNKRIFYSITILKNSQNTDWKEIECKIHFRLKIINAVQMFLYLTFESGENPFPFGGLLPGANMPPKLPGWGFR